MTGGKEGYTMKAVKEVVKITYSYTFTLNEEEVEVLKKAVAMLAGEALDHPERFKSKQEAADLNDAAADLYSTLYHVMKD